MTFTEYVNQESPKLGLKVEVTESDIHSSYINSGTYIRLDILGTIYTYKLIDGRLWTTDSDGNHINRTPFRYIS